MRSCLLSLNGGERGGVRPYRGRQGYAVTYPLTAKDADVPAGPGSGVGRLHYSLLTIVGFLGRGFWGAP